MPAAKMRQKKFSILRGKRSFRRNDDGSTVVEFALVILPFLACMFAIIEVGLVFFAGQVLETSVADASRMILTGQAQAQSFDPDKFRTQICTTAIQALFKCTDIKFDVRPIDDWSGSSSLPSMVGTTTNPTTGQVTKQLDDGNYKYDMGTQCKIIVVRVVYEWPTFVRGLGLDLATLSDGKHLLMSTAVFRNEPYGAGFC